MWYKISVNGVTGYIISSYVSVSTKQENSSDDSSSAVSGIVVVTGSTVNIRSGAGTSYSKLGKVGSGELLTCTGSIVSDGTTWYMVDYNGQTGYISADYSRIASTVRVTGAVVNVRSDAGTQYARVGSVRRGQTYDLTGSKKASDGVVWYEIQWNGQTAYICGTYVQLA